MTPSHPLDTLSLARIARHLLAPSAQSVQLWGSLPGPNLDKLRSRVQSKHALLRRQEFRASVLLLGTWLLTTLLCLLIGGFRLLPDSDFPILSLLLLLGIPFAQLVWCLQQLHSIAPVLFALNPLASDGARCLAMSLSIKSSEKALAYRDQALSVRDELLFVDEAMARYCVEQDKSGQAAEARRKLCLDVHTWSPADGELNAPTLANA